MGVYSAKLHSAFYIKEIKDPEFFLKATCKAFNALMLEFESKLLKTGFTEKGTVVNESGVSSPYIGNDMFIKCTGKSRATNSGVKKALWNDDVTGGFSRLFDYFGKIIKNDLEMFISEVMRMSIVMTPFTLKINKKDIDVSSFKKEGLAFEAKCRSIGAGMNPELFAELQEKYIKMAIGGIKIKPIPMIARNVAGTFTGIILVEMRKIYGNV